MFYDARNNAAVLTLVPIVQGKANDILWWCKQNGIEILITQGFRSWSGQAWDYASGRFRPGSIVTRAKPGYSFHQYGVAFDFVPTDLSGGIHYNDMNRIQQVAHFAKSQGWEWGGDWPEPATDNPHLQFTQGHDINFFRNGGLLS